ncbi:holo-ACP synthase [Oscillatoria acuminata]|uniref:Holo-[acyl-carrier-protein] synthase n=1 Tax=Oscillatoria acuminata PCC 6304 TaxID=56110 RepID=K9TFL4_9CYAN|nr:holo-ACP synthase [Oscillatoria acuminata]AFY80789.1 holo-(acyl-carrier-protein) synthase [Oscillatoria acuminata PCC 6304]
MNIIGHGIDIIETQRIKKIIERFGNRFEARCFTEKECFAAECSTNRVQYFTGRFAAKEAVLKALGTGWAQGISWTDIEIERLSTGKPLVVLYGRCQEIAADLGIARWFLSISHTDSYAVASAIALGSMLVQADL